jgi:hypothetical protein
LTFIGGNPLGAPSHVAHFASWLETVKMVFLGGKKENEPCDCQYM